MSKLPAKGVRTYGHRKKISGFIEKASWIRKMFEEGERLRKIHGADKVYDFTLGNPNLEPPKQYDEEFRQLAEHPIPGMHRYMSNAGLRRNQKSHCAILVEHSGMPVTEGHVIMTCGASGALNVTLKTILNPGEEVIILTPYFVEYKFYIDNHGGVPVEVWTDRETFQLDPSAIEAAITEKTRAIMICSPNNPPGSSIRRKPWRSSATFSAARRRS
jgi:aspartate aminotransferase